jgi:hypothetical protein
MQQMPKIIISDTSCFIVLSNIGELDLLHKVYGEIVTTVDIAIEFGEHLPDWVAIEKVEDKYRKQLLEIQNDSLSINCGYRIPTEKSFLQFSPECKNHMIRATQKGK